ncbi:hypothetical protein BSL78_26220 [Apostichopus japonicus]|uniref:Lysosome-associated membrane glycoprotein 1 n=1 Tax=Stichopus japonicus TaxID=307972 RepID=A0A2G8JMG1_STIJA|nr:hypothetical protein BSL78_26220 [Apostichopus japonicus]
MPTDVGVTPSPDIPSWTVRDDSDTICMLMALNATLETLYLGQIPVPQYASVDRLDGACGSSSAYLKLHWLHWQRVSYTFTITISFEVHGSSYTIQEFNGTEVTGTTVTSWRSASTNFPSAAVGHCMTCHDFEAGSLLFYYYQFQPFAQKSGEEYGKGEECNSGGNTVHVNFFLILAVIVVVVLIVAMATGGVVFFIRMRKRTAYTQVQ